MMTVQELLNKLNAVQDKSKKVTFYCNHEYATIENGDEVDLENAEEFGDCISLTY